MTLKSLLHRPIESLPPEATCVEAARRMRRTNVGAIVVAQDDVPVGIVTDRDLALSIVADERDPARVLLGQVMTPCPAFAYLERSLEHALDTMSELGVRRLPAVDEHGKLVGMLSLDDALLHLAAQLGRAGAAIRRELARTSPAGGG